MSPFDPMAMLDEIQRLVPDTTSRGMDLLSGVEQHTRPMRARRGPVPATAN